MLQKDSTDTGTLTQTVIAIMGEDSFITQSSDKSGFR